MTVVTAEFPSGNCVLFSSLNAVTSIFCSDSDSDVTAATVAL